MVLCTLQARQIHLLRSFLVLKKTFSAVACDWRSSARKFGCKTTQKNRVKCMDSGRVEEAWVVFQNTFPKNVVSWNMMIRAFTGWRYLQEARHLFHKMPCTNLHSWNLITSACSKLESGNAAKKFFDWMPERNFMTWNSVISGYAQFGHMFQAHEFIDRMPEHNVVTWTCVMDAYAKNSCLFEATSLFLQMPERNIVSWNAMLQGYAQGGRFQEAGLVFSRIPQMNVITSTAMITSYAGAGTSGVKAAKAVFDKVPYPDPICWNALLSVYAQNGDVVSSKVMFDECPDRDIVSWNNLIQAFAENGHVEGVKSIFEMMPERCAVSWTALLVACTQRELLEDAKMIFDIMPVRTVVSWTAMVVGFAHSGLVNAAKTMFDRSPQQDEVSWSAMISGFALNGCGNQALELFKLMDLEGLRVDAVTYVSAIDACSGLAALSDARLLHRLAVECGYESEMIVGNSLVNVYGKCGQTAIAKQVFDGMPRRNVYSWTGLISAYSQNGLSEKALNVFQDMKLEGVEPGSITLMCLLNICSHAGLVEAARGHFSVLIADYGLEPTLDHYVCLVDCLGRSGRVEQAEELLNHMPYEPDGVAWMTLLGACETTNNFDVGYRAVQRVMILDPEKTSAYVLMCGILRGRLKDGTADGRDNCI